MLPARLLGIGLPLTIVLGTAAAALLFGNLTLVEAALIAAILAPTDAALGQAVVSDKRLPVRLRQGLNVESGLNDGIMVPVVTVFLAIAATQTGAAETTNWGAFAAQQIGFGILFGVLVGGLGGWALNHFARAGFVDGIYRQLATIAIAVAAYASAGVVGGNGFIAAFAAGLAFSYVASDECRNVQDFTEDEGELLGSITFLIFGAVLAAPVLGSLTWQIALYVVLSLTVVRMIPVLIALAWSRTRFETRLYIGWFGPRGLASILFALLVFDRLTGTVADTVFSVAVWTILVSVFAHGATASPWTTRLARRLACSAGIRPGAGARSGDAHPPTAVTASRHKDRGSRRRGGIAVSEHPNAADGATYGGFMATVTLTSEAFGDTVAKSGITLVDFWAEWCGPCRQFAPVFEAASEANPDVTFAKVDTEVERELSSAAGISSIPTLMAFRDGVLVFSQPGALPAPALDQVIAAVRALDMDEVHKKVAEQREAAESVAE